MPSDDQFGDGVSCPHPECESDPFDTERAMKIHHTRAHGESLIEMRECQQCGEEFRPHSERDPNKHCSRECRNRAAMRRVEKTCQECGDTFTAVKSEARGRKYCSRECTYASQTDRTQKTCPCGIRFETIESKDRETCSRACRSELETDKPRPDDVEMLLWLLYVYEDNNMDQTHRRANICLDGDDRIARTDVSDRLYEMGVHHNQGLLSAQEAAEKDQSETADDGDDSWRRYQMRGEA